LHNEQKLQPYPEEGGLSAGAQFGIAAFFVGLPFLEMGVTAAGLGETAMILAGLGAAGIGVGTGLLIDRNRDGEGEQSSGNRLMHVLVEASGLDRLQHADWGALLRPIGAPAPVSLEQVHDALDDKNAIQEAYILNLGITFRPHPNDIFSNRLVILGMPGAGKSNTVAVIAEELGQYDAPLIIFDQKPEYDHLCAYPYLIKPYRAGAFNVTSETAFAFGQKMMNERLQVVLDLTTYKNDDLAALVMIDIIKGVWSWEEALKNKDRIPCTFFLEEADYWLPQSEQHAHVDRSREKGGKSLFNLLQMAFFNLIHRGRSFGMGCIVSTQRPANVDNRAIAVAEWKILLKANMPNDLKVYQGFGLDPDAAQVLGKGEAYVIGPDVKGTYQIRLRKSPDEAQTPGLGNLQRKTSTPSVTPSQASSVSPSSAPSDGRAKLHVVEGGRSDSPSGTKGNEGADPFDDLSEREIRIGDLFFNQGKNPAAIAKIISGVSSGDAYVKASAEVADAIRKYVKAQLRGA
jgi:Helicase HerA, central domain